MRAELHLFASVCVCVRACVRACVFCTFACICAFACICVLAIVCRYELAILCMYISVYIGETGVMGVGEGSVCASVHNMGKPS